MSLLRMEKSLLFSAGNTQSQGILDVQDYKQILDDQVKIGPVTETEVFESAGALLIEVQVPSRQTGNVKCCARISRGIEQYAQQLLPKRY